MIHTWLPIALRLKPQLSVMEHNILGVHFPDHLPSTPQAANLTLLSKHMDTFCFSSTLGCSHAQHFELALF